MSNQKPEKETTEKEKSSSDKEFEETPKTNTQPQPQNLAPEDSNKNLEESTKNAAISEEPRKNLDLFEETNVKKEFSFCQNQNQLPLAQKENIFIETDSNTEEKEKNAPQWLFDRKDIVMHKSITNQITNQEEKSHFRILRSKTKSKPQKPPKKFKKKNLKTKRFSETYIEEVRTCNDCHKRFSNFYHLARHQEQKHKNSHKAKALSFFCTECSKYLKNKASVRDHILTNHKPKEKVLALPTNQFSHMVNSAIFYSGLNFGEIRTLLSNENAPLILENPKETKIKNIIDSLKPFQNALWKAFPLFPNEPQVEPSTLKAENHKFYFYDVIKFPSQFDLFPRLHVIQSFFLYAKTKDLEKKVNNFKISFVCPLHHVVSFPCFIAVTCLVGKAQIHLRNKPFYLRHKLFSSTTDSIYPNQSKLREPQPQRNFTNILKEAQSLLFPSSFAIELWGKDLETLIFLDVCWDISQFPIPKNFEMITLEDQALLRFFFNQMTEKNVSDFFDLVDAKTKQKIRIDLLFLVEEVMGNEQFYSWLRGIEGLKVLYFYLEFLQEYCGRDSIRNEDLLRELKHLRR